MARPEHKSGQQASVRPVIIAELSIFRALII